MSQIIFENENHVNTRDCNTETICLSGDIYTKTHIHMHKHYHQPLIRIPENSNRRNSKRNPRNHKIRKT